MALDEDLHAKMVELARSLLNGTKRGKVAWTPTDSEYEFLYSGTRSSVTIEAYEDRDEGRVSTLRLRNDHGTVVDSLQSEYENTPGGTVAAEWNEVLEDLFFAARRVAHNVDDAIDSLLADIESGKSVRTHRAANPPSEPTIIRGAARRKSNEDPWDKENGWGNDNSGYSDEPPF